MERIDRRAVVDNTLDEILFPWRAAIGEDFPAYRNHCARVANLCAALTPQQGDEAMEKIATAAAFHDLGIWSHKTFDYLEPSQQLARLHLVDTGRADWSGEIEAMIAHHHKVRPCHGHPEWLVEAFRQADWIDVSRGRLRFGLPAAHVAAVLAAFPNEGFHKRLLELTWQHWRAHPLKPLPMMRW